MRVLVVHASRFGATAGIAERIAQFLGGRDLRAECYPVTELANLSGANAVVMGSAVHGGHWLDEATQFVYRHKAELRLLPVWLFSSGPVGDRAVAAPQPDPREIAAFRQLLGPRDHVVFPGAYDRQTADFSHSSLVERTLVARLLPEGDWRDWEAIDRWAERIADALLATPAPTPTA